LARFSIYTIIHTLSDRYLYTFSNSCREDPGLELGDETLKIVVNITGKVGDISPELREIIRYFQTGEPVGAYTRQLEEAVNKVKTSEERRREYMIAMCREMEIREEGREEGIREGRKEGAFNMLISLVKKGILSMKTAAEEAGVSEEEFTKRYLKKA
jgi:predicted transposase/invertase (TIGR01784 family)